MGGESMSDKSYDPYGRWRGKTVAFRMSEEEAELLDVKVRCSGLTKQDYLVNRLLGWEIKVDGNPKVYKALKDEMKAIYEELLRIEAGQIMDDDLLEVIRIVAVTLEGMKEECEWN